MSRVSKGKIKNLWELYQVQQLLDIKEFWLASQRWAAMLDNPKVKALLRAGIKITIDSDTLAQPVGKDYYAGVRRLQNELDAEFVYSVDCKETNQTYMTFSRGKHHHTNDHNFLLDRQGKVLAYDFEANLLDATPKLTEVTEDGMTHTEFTPFITKQREFNIVIDRTKERTPGYVEVACSSFDDKQFPVLPPGA